MYAFSYIFYGAFYTSYRNFCFAKTPRKYRKCFPTGHFHIFSRAVSYIFNYSVTPFNLFNWGIIRICVNAR